MSISSREIVFEDVCSVDFLNFKFGGRGYQDQLYDSIAKTDCLAGVKVEILNVNVEGVADNLLLVWVTHNFGFLGGSLGCAEGEKITRAFEYGLTHKCPVVVQCRSGGARMQEGTSSLMQMAKVSVAVDALRRAGLPFIVILNDPTYGGVSASYAMQGDVRIATQDARVGFAGPQVILNTMCEADQAKFDATCPPDFQSADYVFQHGAFVCCSLFLIMTLSLSIFPIIILFPCCDGYIYIHTNRSSGCCVPDCCERRPPSHAKSTGSIRLQSCRFTLHCHV